MRLFHRPSVTTASLCRTKNDVTTLPTRTYESRTSKNFVKEDLLKGLPNRPRHVEDLFIMLFSFGINCSLKQRRSTRQAKLLGSRNELDHWVPVTVNTIGICTKNAMLPDRTVD